MHLEVDENFIEDLKKNTFLGKKVKEFLKLKNEEIPNFLNENPDFSQMMMHLSSSDKIKVVYD